ncbi:hypothetical protein BHU62_09345 [Serratia marcescens]|uniref:Fimbrial-type adhesion domain-containing protein n=2 Tax=Serratia marcescens TaxID=615 RepID=A0A1Q4P1R0_SERMA|nr:hypothetical protein BHU62_09345 [Serratia marcescens]
MWLFISVMLSPAVWAAQAGDNNLAFNGVLVTDPCSLDPDSAHITLDFGNVVDKYLYRNTRTRGQLFEIRLRGCDLRLGNTVSVMFSGPEDPALPGMLALSAGSARGIAIGMALPDGTSLPINKATPVLPLVQGVTTLAFKSYIQGEPTALSTHTITRGPFTAVATFTLNYE